MVKRSISGHEPVVRFTLNSPKKEEEKGILCFVIRHLSLKKQTINVTIDEHEVKIFQLKPPNVRYLEDALKEFHIYKKNELKDYNQNFQAYNTLAAIEVYNVNINDIDNRKKAEDIVNNLCAFIRLETGAPCLIEFVFGKSKDSNCIQPLPGGQYITSYLGEAKIKQQSLNEFESLFKDLTGNFDARFFELSEIIALAIGSARNLVAAYMIIWTICEDISKSYDDKGEGSAYKELKDRIENDKGLFTGNNKHGKFINVLAMTRYYRERYVKSLGEVEDSMIKSINERVRFLYEVRNCTVHEGKCSILKGLEAGQQLNCRKPQHCLDFVEQCRRVLGAKSIVSGFNLLERLRAMAQIFLCETYGVPYDREKTWKRFLE